MQVIAQDDWGLGMIRSVDPQKIPAAGAYDIVNGILDGGALFRRGGSEYHNAAVASSSLVGVMDAPFPATGRKTLAWAASGSTSLWRVSGSSLVSVGVTPGVGGRIIPVGHGVTWAVQSSSTQVDTYVYGGSAKAAGTSASVTLTADSPVVTASGTSWLTTVDAGMMLNVTGSPGGGSMRSHMVAKVTSNTQLELVAPWDGSTLSTSVQILPIYTDSMVWGANSGYFALGAAGTPPRILQGIANRVWFLPRGWFGRGDTTISNESYHDLPGDAMILGIQGRGGFASIFTTNGVWEIGDFNYDLTDAFGNVQHSVRLITPEVILWGQAGLAQYSGQTIVPAIDDIYVMSGEGVTGSLAAPIRPLYRDYVKQGLRPGAAAVYRGHYVLPIVQTNGTWVDTLICQLDSAVPAWVRWSGQAASTAGLGISPTSSGSPRLIAATGTRISDLSACFAPESDNHEDADGTTHNLTVETRAFAPRGQIHSLWGSARLRYELDIDPDSGPVAVTVDAAVGAEPFVGTAAGGQSAGEDARWFRISRRSQAVKLRIKTIGATARFVLRSLELHYRPSGKP